MIWTADRLVKQMRDVCNAAGSTAFSDSAALRFLNGAMGNLYTQVRTESESYFVRNHTSYYNFASFTTDANDVSRHSAVFPSWHIGSIAKVYRRRPGGNLERILHIGQPNTVAAHFDPDRDNYVASALRYELIGDSFVLHGTIDSTLLIDLHYERAPAPLFIAKVKAGSYVAAVDSSSATFKLLYSESPLVETFGSGTERKGDLMNVSGFYIGSWLSSIETGIQTPREVIAYTPAATESDVTIRGVAAELSAGTPNIASVLDMPSDWGMPLVLSAAMTFFAGRGNMKARDMVGSELGRIMAPLLISIRQRRNDSPNYQPESFR